MNNLGEDVLAWRDHLAKYNEYAGNLMLINAVI
jgi:hypothetical protein